MSASQSSAGKAESGFPMLKALTAGIVLAVAGLAGLQVGAVGTTRYVDDTDCSPTGPGTLTNPYCLIQDAICASASGDTVSVAPGTYAEAIRMRPGVSVISQQGAAETTINAAGKPCTDSNFCTKRPGSTQCSVVTFASGHYPDTVLDGFTITGGAGLPQASPDKVSGGGIYVFSSPTIVNNVITNNVLAGPSPNNRDMRGAGVYVALGSPLISNNTISGNRAQPPAGASGAVTFGYGGGVWLSVFSAPSLTNNIIQGNRAGDPNAAYSLGTGGGVVSFPPGSSLPAGHLIDRNLIADNVSDNKGGGVALVTSPTTVAPAVVTNNVIVGNNAKNGGGVYVYFVQATVQNNTITGNNAFLGAGVYLGQGDVAFPVAVTSNIIEGNTLDDFGTGGGIYKLDLDPVFEPVIQYNDLWGNERNNVGGDRSDADTIGVNGNFSADPQFVNRGARDFHLDLGSPAIDRATSSGAPPVDKDNIPRGQDGDGSPDNPVPGDVDTGAYEVNGQCTPLTETCDGVDNNCDLQIDEGLGSTTCGVGACEVTVQNCIDGNLQTCTPGSPSPEVCGDGVDNDCNGAVDDGSADTDGDAMLDCVDPDDDNDSALDGDDCAPLDASAFGMPYAVSDLDVVSSGPPTTMQYQMQFIGSGTTYEIISGSLLRLAETQGFQEGFCLTQSTTGGTWQDPRPAPRTGEGWYYLIRSANACGTGTFGTALRDLPGSGDACQLGHVDEDADGSPSHLDCNDADGTLAPNLPELCDGADNNCDMVADENNPGGGIACGSSVGECSAGLTQCSAGELSCVGAVGPAPETCDGLDNDCDTVPDNNVPDSDLDGDNDCLDSDDDNDAAPDEADCAPLDASAFGMPVEVQDLDVLEGSPTPITWLDQALGTGTHYDVATGQISAAGIVVFTEGTCLAGTTGSPAVDDRAVPPPDTAWYYLVKSRNNCGTGTYGSLQRDTHPACP